MVRHVCFILWLVLSAGSAQGQTTGALTAKIAVWRVDALGIDPALVAQLDALFRLELGRLAKYPLPSRAEAERLAGRELGQCTGADKCLAAIGQKLGVEIMVTGSVAALGDNYILDIKAVAVATGKELRRVQTEPLRGEPDELIESIRVAAYRLLAPAELFGTIMVLSDLVGATVTLDGKAVGETPLPSLERIPLGKHKVDVARDGFSPFTETVDVRFQKTTRVVVRLDPREAKRIRRQHTRSWYDHWYVWAAAGVLAVGGGAYLGYTLGHVDCRTPQGAATPCP